MSGAESLLVAELAGPELLASLAPEAAAAALPAGGMAATGGMLGTGASAFGGAGALSGLGLEGAGLGMEGALSAGMPASLAPFSSLAMGPSPELAGSFVGAPSSLWSGSTEVPFMDRMGARAAAMGSNLKAGFNPQNLMLGGMKMAGQGLLGGQQQQIPNHAPSMQMQPYQPVQVPQTLDEARRKRRDELLRQMLGGR